MASPDDSFGPAVARIPAGSDTCHQGCAYTVLQLFKGLECAVLSMVRCTIIRGNRSY